MPIVRDAVTGLVSLAAVDPDLHKNPHYTDPKHGAVRLKHVEYIKEEQRRRLPPPVGEGIPKSHPPQMLRLGPDDAILLPDDEHGGACPNARDRRDMTVHGSVDERQLRGLVAAGAPLMNRLAQLCRSAKLRACRWADCVGTRERLAPLAPLCAWPGFRDWVLQLLACQLSADAERRLERPFFHMAAAAGRCHWLLLEAKATDQGVPGLLAGPGKSTVELEVFGVTEVIYWMLTIQFELGFNPVLEGRWMPDFLPAAVTGPAVANAAEQARKLGICQNRFWNLALSAERQHVDLPGFIAVASTHTRLAHKDHGECTPAFCLQTTLNSTTVKQLHKCPDPLSDPCSGTDDRRRLHFDAKLLEESIEKGGRTVWSTDAPFRVTQDEPYIAISHVWSDGTGVGVQPPGRVNECLFSSLADVAGRLKCTGIWWDTISIPEEPKLRRAAIRDMHRNYAEAEYTVLHDRYLLDFEWSDDGAPCLALVLSPWLTRGWTALELIMSRRVKVLYKAKGEGGDAAKPLIKDLDDDILARDPSRCSRGHWIASTIIRRLRRDIGNVSDLVAVLRPRSTSWERDRMLIAGLLAGVDDADLARPPHELTKAVVDRVARVNASALHHGQPPLAESGGWSWCPPSLYDMPSDTVGDLHEVGTVGDATCVVDRHGALAGGWHWRPLTKEDGGRLLPNSPHLSVVLKIRDAATRGWDRCMLLYDNRMADGPALLVQPLRRGRGGFVHARFVGSVREVGPRAAPRDSDLDYDFFKLGAADDDGRAAPAKAARFSQVRARRQPKRQSSSSARDYERLLCGRLWMGDHAAAGQLLVARRVGDKDDDDVVEAFAIRAGMHDDQGGDGDESGGILLRASTELSLSDEPVFRVRANSGVGVDGDGDDDPAVAVRRVRPEAPWPPATIPAEERTYDSASQGPYSRNIFKLKDGSERHIYAAIYPRLYTPDDECPYRGIWTGVSAGYGPMFVLFYQPHPGRLEVIALTGDRTKPRGSLQFVVEDIHDVRRTCMQGKWAGLPIVRTMFPTPEDMPPPDVEIDLLLVSMDEVIFMPPGGSWVQLKRVSVDELLGNEGTPELTLEALMASLATK